MRIKIIRIIIVGLFMLIVCDLIYLQVIRGGYYFQLSKNNRIRIIPLQGWRGIIKDRNDIVLADNRVSHQVMVIPQELEDEDRLFTFLSQTLDVEKIKIARVYAQKKVTPFSPVVLAKNVPRQKAIIIEENRYKYPGLWVEENFERVYPLGAKTAHVLGYVGKISSAKIEELKEYGYSSQSIVGYAGAEEYYDQFLRGEEGGVQLEVNNRGEQVRLLGIKQPKQGQNLTLTIDSGLQGKSTELLESHIGTIIVMDTANGEILSLASAPSFDPNVFLDTENSRKLQNLFSDPSSPLLNRAIKGLYPPGSVFKVPVSFCALDYKAVNPQTSFECPGFYELGGRRFGCTHQHGQQNLTAALAHSCNVYFYRVGRLLGIDKMNQYARIFGLGSLTHIDLPYESKGNVPGRILGLINQNQKWYAGDTLNFSIGQGKTQVTPLQLLKMISVVANNGRSVTPHVISTIGEAPVSQYASGKMTHLNGDALQIVQSGLRASVVNPDGTAHALSIEGLYVAGKTGTAQSSGEKDSHAWFAGYAKGKVRNIAFCIFLEHGGSSYNATVLGREILMYMQQEKIL